MLLGHEKQWDFLKNKFEADQLSHAYLFSGEEGIGKKKFAIEFSEFIGCKFPDLKIVSEKNKRDPLFADGGEIKISQIREVQNFLSYKAYNNSYKIVIIDEAEKMNQEAQNCFLKTLEEPKGKTLLFLITSKPDMLLPTITSRCQLMKFFKPKDLPANKEKYEREQKIFGEVVKILNSDISNKFKYIKSIDFQEQDPLEIVVVMQKYLRQLMLDNLILSSPLPANYPISRIKNALNLTDNISNKLIFANANAKLALETLLINC